MRDITDDSLGSADTLRGVVPATYVDLLYDYLTARGVDALALLGPKPVIDKGIGRYPVTRWKKHLQDASEALNDPLLGLHLGETISPKHLGVLGYVLLSCGTLGAALLRLQQYHQLIYDVNPMEITTSEEHVTLLWGLEMGKPGRLVDETAIAALLQFSRDIIGLPSFAALSIEFVNSAPADSQPYEDWFGCPVIFAQDATRITMNLSDLARPLRTADAALTGILEQQANQLLSDLTEVEVKRYSSETRHLIIQQMHQMEPTAVSVAAALNLSSRTLHRKLRAEQTSFRELLRQTRHQLAKQYLSDPRLQLSDIAQLLAYSEQSAFTRAFKIWQGQSPAQYRRI